MEKRFEQIGNRFDQVDKRFEAQQNMMMAIVGAFAAIVAVTIGEVGGKGKGRTQFKGIKADRKLILSHGDKIDELHRPLFLLGYLE
ncbi:MAG: hypothetical protein R6V20_08315 [Desulfobia sp.]